jgi:hypothetical protein
MTGRGAGYCAGYSAPGYANPVWGRGFGMGRGGGWGRGRGWRNMYYATGMPGWARYGYGPAWGPPPAGGFGAYGAPSTPEEEVEFLRSQAEMLKGELDGISERIKELEKQGKKK